MKEQNVNIVNRRWLSACLRRAFAGFLRVTVADLLRR
jgi:hypothetical protein